MDSGEEPEIGHDIVKMRVLGVVAMVITITVAFRTPYVLLDYIGALPPRPPPPGWPTDIWLYLHGASSLNFGFRTWYNLSGLSLYDSTLFWVLSLIVALQFLHPAWGRKRLAVHLVVLLFSVAVWILGAYAIYGKMTDFAVVPMPTTPVVALIALLLIWMVSKR